jgi:signal transduction histidine kinase
MISVSFYRKCNSKDEKRRVILSAIGVISFLIFFFSSTFIVSLLADSDSSLYVYNYEIYGLFGMPILLMYLGYLIVKYRAFNLKIFTTQGLIFALIALIGSEFFFAQNTVSVILVAITFILVIILGRFLIKSVRREIESRELIAMQKDLLEKANDRLKVLDKQKTEFVSLASHQLRAPMTAIRGYGTMILDGDFGDVPSTIKEPLNHILSSTKSLIQIVGDFLDVTRIELGTMKFTFSDFDFKDLIKDVIAEFAPNIEKSNLEFKYEVPEDKMPLHGDAAKIRQVLNNLIDNAIKYTKQGWVHVKLEKVATKYRFSVQDSGVGINPETLPKLFEKFIRAGNANEANVIGTGLGLYVAKQMIQKHNGRIWAESEGEGKGSTFVVEIDAGK